MTGNNDVNASKAVMQFHPTRFKTQGPSAGLQSASGGFTHCKHSRQNNNAPSMSQVHISDLQRADVDKVPCMQCTHFKYHGVPCVVERLRRYVCGGSQTRGNGLTDPVSGIDCETCAKFHNVLMVSEYTLCTLAALHHCLLVYRQNSDCQLSGCIQSAIYPIA